MKKFLIIFVLIIISFAQWSIAEDKMTVLPSLMNNGFEEAEQGKPKYWRFFGPEDAIIWDSQVYKEGKHSTQILLQTRDVVRLQQAVEVEAFVRYYFGGAVKTESLDDGFAQINIIFLDKNGNEIKGTSVDMPKLSGTQGWTFEHVWVESPSGADAAYIICFVNGKGKAWFDDIYFTTKIKGGY
ncbi:MAG: hypothetical protein AB1847_21545 [bacterium]